MLDIIVTKFGGSSITSFKDIERIKKITKDDTKRKIIVVSAPGKRNKEDIKVTDILIELAKTKNPALIKKITDRYKELFPKIDIDYLSELFYQYPRREQKDK